MAENLIDELIRRLNAKTIHELRQLGRALGVPHPADGKKSQLLEEIIAVASGRKDSAQSTKRGAPPKSQEYDRQLAADVLRCREIFLAKNLTVEENRPKEIFVANGNNGTLDYIGGGIMEYDGDTWFLRTTGCREDIGADVFVNRRFVETFKLREGDYVEGRCKRETTEEMAGLVSVLKVNGFSAITADRPEFDNLVPVYAENKLKIACGSNDRAGRIIDMFAPLGAGQRVLVISPHGCGKTRLLKDIAFGIEQNNSEVKLVAVLIDVSPEDAADFAGSFKHADVFTSPFDAGTGAHIRTMRLALEYCKRQTELCRNVVLVIDDMTRLVRAYNACGRQITPGLDYSAIDAAKKVLAAARNTVQGGSLTVISALNTGSGDVIEDGAFSALKDICNAKITLSLKLARERIYPPIDFSGTFSALDEKLLTDTEMRAAVKLKGGDAVAIIELIEGTEDNGQLTEQVLR